MKEKIEKVNEEQLKNAQAIDPTVTEVPKGPTKITPNSEDERIVQDIQTINKFYKCDFRVG